MPSARTWLTLVLFIRLLGSAPERAEARGRRWIRLQRTTCMGECPAYVIDIAPDGTAVFTGQRFVPTPRRTRTLSRAEMEALDVAFSNARFFDLNESVGEVVEKHPPPRRHADGSLGPFYGTVTANICTDAAHAKLTYTKNGRSHSTDDAHCAGETTLSRLEDTVDEIVGTKAWLTPTP